MKKLIIVTIGAIFFVSCSHNSSQTHQSKDDIQGHTDEESHEVESVTLFSEHFEVFTEFDRFTIGHKSELLIHITQLNDDYSALSEGKVDVMLEINGQRQTTNANISDVAGILKASLIPEHSGVGSLAFIISQNLIEETLIADHIHVYAEGERDDHEQASGESGLIRFTKEQAWKSDFNVVQIEHESFSQVVTVSGEFLAMPGEKQNVIAKSQGIVLFAKKNLVQGKYVNKGDEMFTLSGQGLADNNIMIRFNEAQTNFLKSQSELNRHKSLFDEKIISEKQFLETQSRYITDSILYYSMKETVSAEGMKIRAPMAGYLHELNVSEGQFVKPGDLMATISTNKVMLLRADVPQQYFGLLADITTTHFRPAYTSRVYTLEGLSGKLIARGASVAENNHYMPVYFEVINDGTLLEGAFAEFYLKTNPEPGHLVIPVSSLIEEQNNFYVYVQVSGEEFQKRSIRLGANDGINASVSSGLLDGERIVSQGAMLIKTASSSGIPAHNHQH